MRIVTHNADYIRQYNRNLVMRLLIAQPMSRAELARKTGLTRQTLSNIAEELLTEQLIEEKQSVERQKGRSPILLYLREDAFYAIGIYISRNFYKIGLVNIKGQVVRIEEIEQDKTADSTEILRRLTDAAERLIASVDIERSKILGVGISSPGPVQEQNGIILNPPDFESWHNVDVVTPIKQKVGMQVLLENNAYSLANYERIYGAGEGIENFILLLVDSGIGCGIVSNGKLYQGTHRLSGEIGHTSINFAGERCSCGNYGCLELYAAIPKLLRRFGCDGGEWQNIVQDAKAGKAHALRIINQEADYLVAGIVNAVNMLDIEAVILDGDIIDVFDLIGPYMEEEINGKIITRSFGTIKLLPFCGHTNHQVAAAANIIFSKQFSTSNAN